MKYATEEYAHKIQKLVIDRGYAADEAKGQMHSRTKITLAFLELWEENQRLRKEIVCSGVIWNEYSVTGDEGK